ncbi:hypothetical protein D1224_11150 [Henriciella barbarensis]|uniref:Uncharacterized protein n=1 Tax=Henriciella barbarensis TaxID=86342 RepID=A0A399QV93_9PROT|nr:hypothetical protein D1224_11150 [Henriciella barbarensis]
MKAPTFRENDAVIDMLVDASVEMEGVGSFSGRETIRYSHIKQFIKSWAEPAKNVYKHSTMFGPETDFFVPDYTACE